MNLSRLILGILEEGTVLLFFSIFLPIFSCCRELGFPNDCLGGGRASSPVFSRIGFRVSGFQEDEVGVFKAGNHGIKKPCRFCAVHDPVIEREGEK